MPLNTTPGDPAANSYVTLAEFNAYIATRLHVPAAILAASDADKEALLIYSTRALDQILSPHRSLQVLKSSNDMTSFYIEHPHWTGTPATTTQGLAWGRNGMFDRNGNAIANDVFPVDLKNSTIEMGLSGFSTDFYAENASMAQGITELVAGPVELVFKDYIQKHALPSSVFLSLVPSWYTNEVYIPAQFAGVGGTGVFRTLGTFGFGVN